MNPEFNVLIIGAGKIGAFFDKPDSQEILTHAHSYRAVNGFNLIGFVDNDIEKAKQASNIWGGQAFNSIEDAFIDNKIDVVSLCSSTNSHYSILKELANLNIKLIFAEKPITNDINEAQEIVKLYKNKNISILVNYIRRFVPEIINIQEKISQGYYGSYITGTYYYGKGIINSGSHIMDLIRYFIGDIKKVTVINSINDYSDYDKSISAVIFFENEAPFYLEAIDHNLYDIGEIDFMFEKGRVKLINGGFVIEEYKVMEDKIYSGYKELVKYKETKSSLDKSFYYSAINIYQHLKNGDKLICSLEDGLKALEMSCKLLDTNNV